MEKTTVWKSASAYIFVDAVACGFCWTLPSQETKCLTSVRKLYTTYYLVKAILLLATFGFLACTHKRWSLNVIYSIGQLIAFWAMLDVIFILILVNSCDDKPTDHVRVIVINIVHSALGAIATVVICIWSICGKQEDRSNHRYQHTQTEDLGTESERQTSAASSMRIPVNENEMSTAEDNVEDDNDTIISDGITEETELATANLITQHSSTCSPLNSRKRRREAARSYRRSNSASKETQPEPISTGEEDTTPTTCPLRGATPINEPLETYIDGLLAGDNEQLTPVKQKDRALIKDDLVSVCQHCLIGVDQASCSCFKANAAG